MTRALRRLPAVRAENQPPYPRRRSARVEPVRFVNPVAEDLQGKGAGPAGGVTCGSGGRSHAGDGRSTRLRDVSSGRRDPPTGFGREELRTCSAENPAARERRALASIANPGALRNRRQTPTHPLEPFSIVRRSAKLRPKCRRPRARDSPANPSRPNLRTLRGHEPCRSGAVPVVFARLEDAVAGADDLDGAAFVLAEADAFGDPDRLAVRMRVPGGAGAGCEVHARGADRRLVRGRCDRVDVDGAVNQSLGPAWVSRLFLVICIGGLLVGCRRVGYVNPSGGSKRLGAWSRP
jgi:hypothetical protein